MACEQITDVVEHNEREILDTQTALAECKQKVMIHPNHSCPKIFTLLKEVLYVSDPSILQLLMCLYLVQKLIFYS